MSAETKRGFVLPAFLALAAALTGQPAPAPQEPTPGGEVLLAGRLAWGPTALPTGEILAPDEDKTMTVLDAQAKILARWRAPDRFAAPVTAAPAGPVLQIAAPLLSGQIVVLAWDAKTRVLAPSYVPSRRSEAAATAWMASGTLVAGWKDGQVEAWQNGTRRWSAATGAEVRFLLVDNAAGVYAFGPGKVSLIDPAGRTAVVWPLEGTPRGVLQTLGGTVVCWTDTAVYGLGDSGFVPLARTKALGVVLDSQGKLVITEAGRIERMGFDGRVLSQIVLPRAALTPAVLDDRGRLLIGTAAGLEEWTYDGRLSALLSESTPSPALLTENGLGAWGTSDWKVHVWSGFRWPAYGWPQEGGNSGRSYAARRPAGVQARASRWTEDPGFTYLNLLASSGKASDQSEALDRIEAASSQGSALWQAPWLNIILLKIARSGLTDLQFAGPRVTNNWPELRLRAFRLLALTAGPEDRDELLSLVHKEFDSGVLAAAIPALTRWGWDGDGRLMRMLQETLTRMSDQPALGGVVIDAARTLWQQNGRSSDPVLIDLVKAVFEGSYPTSVKLQAQKLFQDVLTSP